MEFATAIAVLCVIFGGFASQWIAWRVNIPAIVLLLVLGLGVGPGFGLIDPSAVFGDTLQPLVSLAVAVVLFEGGMALNYKELRETGSGVLRLTLAAVPLSLGLGALAGFLITDMSFGIAILFGSILIVTGPTVILPLLRQARLKPRPAAFLKWEGIVNDPVGAMVAAVTLEILVLRQHAGAEVADFWGTLIFGLVIGVALGVGAAYLVWYSFRKDLVPEFLKSPMILTLVLTIHPFANIMLHESGLVAVTVFGVLLANMNVAGMGDLTRMKEALVVIIVSALFIVLASDLEVEVLTRLSLPLLAVTAAIVFIVRPVTIMLVTIGSGMFLRERLLVSWIGPRGIVAAAVAGLAAIKLDPEVYPSVVLLQPAVFSVIAATVLLHGFSLRPLARRLDLVATRRPSILIVGASPWTTNLAQQLHNNGVPVTLADTYAEALEDAKKDGIDVLRAEVLAEKGEEALRERAHDYVLAATPDEIYNALVCASLSPEIGRERVLQLAAGDGRLLDESRGLSRDLRGKIWADETLNYRQFEERFEKGWRVVPIEIDSDQLPEDGYASETVVPLILVRSDDSLVLYSPEGTKAPNVAQGDVLFVFEAPTE
ncbi:potassium/proton antiporter [Jannaschia seosinensis]|uniref:Potassium/proton antiporter n=1 Tax=Jannaschia seosinensis TaxID=313367 RepID=A0A0M7BDN9_9RHOB|nr:sodium:proton antiporter [Jannaschia seosinensis]CUH40917.1 potassium/proton antiporter [Jannaschia seosinensis]